MPASPRRFLLRERTSERHSSVDAAVGSFSTLEQYRQYLQGIHAFRVPVEQALQSISLPAHFQGWSYEAIGEEIRLDMADLDTRPQLDMANIYLSSDLETVLGALYVLEGSALGARILISRAGALGLSRAFGARHLAKQADSAGWRAYLEKLDSAPAIDMEKVVEASQAVFALAERAFKGS